MRLILLLFTLLSFSVVKAQESSYELSDLDISEEIVSLEDINEDYENAKAEAITRFINSVISDEIGNVRGVYIGEIVTYMSKEEALDMLPLTDSARGNPFPDNKPKGKRGCKRKLNWLCFPPADNDSPF